METRKKIIEVYETMDYSIFNRLLGNRDVTNTRVSIIKDSIESVGYISNPIICNEKLEVIDGQGRLEALKQLEMPVEYVITSGIGIQECRAMNLKPTSWSTIDFIKSYAEYGIDSYIKILKLQEKYGFNSCVLYAIVKKANGYGRSPQEDFRNGTFKVSDEEYDYAEKTCEYLKKFEDIQDKIGGRKDVFYINIAWVVSLKGVDKERLYYSIQQNANEISPTAKSEHFLKEISYCYNKGYGKKNRRYFDYEKKMSGSKYESDDE